LTKPIHSHETTKQTSLVTHNGVEEGGLSNVGQADDASAEAHANPRAAGGRKPPRPASLAPAPAHEGRRGAALVVPGRRGRRRRLGPRESRECGAQRARRRCHGHGGEGSVAREEDDCAVRLSGVGGSAARDE
jgi:hypothetical protein